MRRGLLDLFLRIVDIKYKELYKAEYLPKGESQILIDSVHSALNSVNYGRYEEQMHKIKPLESENKGFVHILADDIKEDVWWEREEGIGCLNLQEMKGNYHYQLIFYTIIIY
ncbi:hypothetical protein OMD49_05565 [Bacillus anthracis]|nr:hypothetical protein [Bacillus anthracis]